MFNSSILFFLTLLIFSCCKSKMDPVGQIKKQIEETYTKEFNLTNDPSYISIYSKELNDSLFRYIWNLDEPNTVSNLSKLFNEFAYELPIDIDDNDYLLFDVVFDRHGRIHQVGFFDSLDRFTGEIFDFYYKEKLILKEAQLRGKRFYEVFYHLDDHNKIIDSSYQYFPIVNSDISYFEGPKLSICFEIKLFIHNKRYNYEDFYLWYEFYDLEDTYDLSQAKEKAKIFTGEMLKSKDGIYNICHDLELQYHLMPVFGIYVDEDVSDQDLTLGTIFGPIINKNIDSHEL